MVFQSFWMTSSASWCSGRSRSQISTKSLRAPNSARRRSKSTENGLASGVWAFSGGVAILVGEAAQPAIEATRRIRLAAVTPRRMGDALYGWRRNPGKPRRHTAHGTTTTFDHSRFAAIGATSASTIDVVMVVGALAPIDGVVRQSDVLSVGAERPAASDAERRELFRIPDQP